MESQTIPPPASLIDQVTHLKNFKFLAYQERIDSDTYVITFFVPDLLHKKALPEHYILDWYVRDHNGYLSATTICGTLHCNKLT